MISFLPPNTTPSSTLLQNKKQNPSYTQERELSNGQPIIKLKSTTHHWPTNFNYHSWWWLTHHQAQITPTLETPKHISTITRITSFKAMIFKSKLKQQIQVLYVVQSATNQRMWESLRKTKLRSADLLTIRRKN